MKIDNENPDYLIFGDDNFGTNNTKFNKKDVVKIFYTGENRRPEDYDCHYAISFDHNYSNWHYRLPLFVIYMWALDQIHNTGYDYYHILQDNEPAPKTDFCSFVVGNPNCEIRNDFFNRSRKFNICFESSSHPGYVTEKILHAFYAKTVPIYWGSPTVTADFNPHAFINVNDFRNLDEVVEFVKVLDSDDMLYNNILAASPFAGNVPRDYMLLNNFLNWFESTVYNKIGAREE